MFRLGHRGRHTKIFGYGQTGPKKYLGDVDGGTEGPAERGAKRRSAEGVGVWGGASRSSSQHGGLGAMPPENFSKINVEIAYFSAFLRTKMVSSVVASRQD